MFYFMAFGVFFIIAPSMTNTPLIFRLILLLFGLLLIAQGLTMLGNHIVKSTNAYLSYMRGIK